MADVSIQHTPELSHHLQQGLAWLTESASGDNTAALSYAALELRFAVERLGLHYWRILLNRKPEERDLRDIGSFKRIEQRIYELAGHQKEINGHFEFMRVVLGAINIDTSFHTPKIGELSNHWHMCSELCHIAWPLSSTVPEVRSGAFASLTSVSQSLSAHISSLGWPTVQDAEFVELRNQFIAGKASRDDVLAYISKIGLWATAEFPDGRPPQFVGDAIVPSTPESTK